MINHKDVIAYERKDEIGIGLAYCSQQKRLVIIENDEFREEITDALNEDQVNAVLYILQNHNRALTQAEILKFTDWKDRSTLSKSFTHEINPLFVKKGFGEGVLQKEKDNKRSKKMWKGSFKCLCHQEHLFPDKSNGKKPRDLLEEGDGFDSKGEGSPEADIVDTILTCPTDSQDSSPLKETRFPFRFWVSFFLFAISLIVWLMINHQTLPSKDIQNKNAATEPLGKVSLLYDVIVTGEYGPRRGTLGMNVKSGEQIEVVFRLSDSCWLSILNLDSAGLHPLHDRSVEPQFYNANQDYVINYILDETIGQEVLIFAYSREEFLAPERLYSDFQEGLSKGGQKGPDRNDCEVANVYFDNVSCFYFMHILN